MRERSPDRITPRSFDRVQRRALALVRVEPGVSVFHRGIVRYFEATRSELGCFLLDPSAASPEFWQRSFRTQVGPLRLASGMPQPGYYLFDTGLVVAHVPTGTAVLRVDDEEVERIVAIGFDGERPTPSDRIGLVRVVVQVEATLHGRAARRDGGGFADDWRDPGPSSSSRSPPPPPPRAPAFDPYEVLGVAPDADLEAIRRAFKEQMKLNHPDRVAHLSPFLQEMAKQQAVRINEAFELLRKLRGG
jgi:hypothetical protein